MRCVSLKWWPARFCYQSPILYEVVRASFNSRIVMCHSMILWDMPFHSLNYLADSGLGLLLFPAYGG